MNNFEGESKILYPEIAAELSELYEKDQSLRQESRLHRTFTDEESKKWEDIHNYQEKRLKEIIEEIGWPTISKVGAEASNAAWLIAQHADRNVSFQKECLELMTAELETEVSEKDIAYLHDRICINEGRPQFFGTQMKRNEFGEYGPHPIEQEEFVDERRKEVGLNTLAEYKDQHSKRG
jgi:hypothetical protein